MARVSRGLLLAAQPLDGGVASHVVGLVGALPARGGSRSTSPARAGRRPGRASRAGPVSAARDRAAPAPGTGGRALAGDAAAARDRADVVHVHSAKAGLPRAGSRRAARGGGGAVRLHAARLVVLGGGRRGGAALPRLERLAAHWCGAIVALSGDEREAGLAAERVGRPRAVPRDPERRRARALRAGRALRSRGRVLMVGRLARRSVRTSRCARSRGARGEVPEAELHVVGDGPLRADAERARGAARGRRGAVRFLGNRDDVPALLAAGGVRSCSRATTRAARSPSSRRWPPASPSSRPRPAASASLSSRAGRALLGAHGDAEGLAAALAETSSPTRLGPASSAREGRRVAEAEALAGAHGRPAHRALRPGSA